jgi:hypothetical protein
MAKQAFPRKSALAIEVIGRAGHPHRQFVKPGAEHDLARQPRGAGDMRRKVEQIILLLARAR